MQSSMLKELGKERNNRIIKVRVARKYIVPLHNDVKKPRCLELVLVDEKGDRIQVTIMPPHITNFDGMLHELSLYYLTNFAVKDNSSKYRTTSHAFRIFFMPITEVIGVGDKHFPKSIFNFKKISDIQAIDNIDDVGHFDFIGHVVAKHSLQHQKINSNETVSKHINVVLQDIESNRITVTLWGPYAEEICNYFDSSQNEHIVIIIQLCRPKKFQGQIGLCNAYHATKLFINVNIPEIEVYKNRLGSEDNSSMVEIQNMSKNVSTEIEDLESRNFELLTLEGLLNCKKIGFCWVVARISTVVSDGDWWYISCNRCRKKLSDSPKGYYCEPCNLRTYNKAVPRYKVKVNVVDGNRFSTFLLWDGVCEVLIGKTAMEIREGIAQGLNENEQTTLKSSSNSISREGHPEELEKLVGRLLLFKVHVKDRNVDESDPVFSVSRICEDQHLIEKHKKTPIDVTKKLDLLTWIANSGEEVIELEDSVSDNEEECITPNTTKRIHVPNEGTTNSSCITESLSSTGLSNKNVKKIKLEKD